MIIRQPKCICSDGNLRYEADFASKTGTHTIFFSLPAQFASCADIKSSNPFLLALLYPAMRESESIHVEGIVSEKLLYELNAYAIPFLHLCDSKLHVISISADGVTNEIQPSASGAGTGFSGGLDSFCTIYDRFVLPAPETFKVNKLFFFNVGAHGIAKNETELEHIRNKFHARYEALKPFPAEIGLDYIPVDSNVHLYHPWGHLETCTLATMSAAVFMQAAVRKYYLSSSGHNYMHLMRYLGGGGSFHDLGMVDPQLLPMISTETMEMIADGTTMDRSQKTEHILDYEPPRRYLNVCAAHDVMEENCSECYKCCRTLLTLEILGRLPDYAKAFDLEKYKSARTNFIADVLVHEKDELFSLHIMDLARKYGFDMRGQISALDLLRARMRGGAFYEGIRNNALARSFFRLLKNKQGVNS